MIAENPLLFWVQFQSNFERNSLVAEVISLEIDKLAAGEQSVPLGC